MCISVRVLRNHYLQITVRNTLLNFTFRFVDKREYYIIKQTYGTSSS